MEVGDKLKFDGERQRYTVQAFNDRFIIATKPFNARKTYLYTIVDRQEKRRGPIGLVFGPPEDVDTPDGAQCVLDEMMEKEWQVSYRHNKLLTDGEIEALSCPPK